MNKKTVFALLPIRCILFTLIFIIGARIVDKSIDDISNWWSIAATAVNIVTIIILVTAARKNNMTYGELINYQKGSTKAKQIVLVSIVIIVTGMAGMNLAGLICYGVIPYAPPMIIAPIPKALAIINALLLPITTAFAEDGLYFGVGVNGIKNQKAAIVIPALFFALQHCFIPTLFDARYIIYRFISFLPCAIILCIYYQKKKNPVPIMVGHALIDVATVMQILATSMIPGLYEKMCSL